MSRRITCILIVLCMTLLCVTASGFGASAAEKEVITTGADYGLADRIEDGNILHCFNWSLSQIKEELPNIAKAGFTAVQTSPLQSHNGNYQWYWLYQPTNFNVGNDLGSYSDLQSLCSAADQYGIKIIVDVVANHLAGGNDGSWSGNIDGSLRKSEYFHNMGPLPDESNDRYDITHKNIGMPDLNSENTELQNKVYAMLTTLKNAGVDGIRWDAAKHIGLPSEGCAFWSKMAGMTGLYQYGEVLEAPANKSSLAVNQALMEEYVQYIDVTDDDYGATVTKAIRDGKVSKSNGNWTKNGISAEKLVYWGESHDTYSNNGTTAWSKDIDQNVVDRAYAVLASRAGAKSLYLSRPSEKNFSSIAYNRKGSVHFTSKEVAAVNHFHNAMIGSADKFVTGSGCYVVCRGGGAAVVSASGSDIDVSVPNGSLVPDGTYTDEISGSTWTVSGGKMTGHIGSTGIAVFYKDLSEIPAVQILRGDADLSDDISITDATFIQRYLVDLETFNAAAVAAADTDKDGEVTVIDATVIQRFLVGLKDPDCYVGELFSIT